MQRKELLEVRDAEKLYDDAAKAELAKQYDAAFRLYVKATETYLHLNRLSDQQEKDRANWKVKAERSLARAEKIKAFIERPKNLHSGSNQSSTSERRLTPVGIDHFSPMEQSYILKRGDLINGHMFPPWNEPIQLLSTFPYQDPDGEPNLSPEQSKVSAYWRRPFSSESSLAEQPDNLDESSSSLIERDSKLYRRSILPQEILQHIVTDCSVCASISVCLEHGRRFGSTLAESAVHQYENPGHSSKSASGRHDVRVLFNGAWRRIVIDDKLPYNPDDGSLMCMFVLPSKDGNDFRSPHQKFWPSLLEKAYMKLMGGYDFPGSNSSIDLHALAGWIPEHIETKGSTFEREKTWERIANGFSSGQCVVTLGTGPRTDIFWRDVKLLESHSYAVIDVYETEEGRILTVLDSWVLHKEDGQQPSRTLRIPWTDVLVVFSGIYLSWDPQNWESSLSFHGMWKRTGEDEHSVRPSRVKFTLNKTSGIDREILVLLTRHIVDSKRTSDYVALRTELEDDFLPHVVDNLVDHVSHEGTYTNSTHVLVRVRIPESQQSGVLAIFPSYEGDFTEVGYTITVYSSGMTIIWDEQLPPPPFTTKVDSVFTSKNAGGNCSYPTFMLNPQYHLHIYPPTSTRQSRPSTNQTSQTFPRALSSLTGPGVRGKCTVTLSMHTSKDIPVNIVATWSQGERVVELPQKDLAMNSGAYSYGLTRVTKDLSRDYTVILSAFEPQHIGPFSLQLDCSSSFDLKPIPQEGAGMYSKIIKSSWDAETAAGGPSFNAYEKNPIFEVEIPCSAQVKFRLQLIHISTPVQMNLTVYPAQPLTSTFSSQTLTRHITTSGPYSDALSGVATPLLNIGAGRYWLVPSTYNPGVEARFRIIMYTSARGAEIKKGNTTNLP